MKRYAVVSFRADEEDKKEFYKFCEHVGLSPASGFNVFMKYCINNQKLPFEVTTGKGGLNE